MLKKITIILISFGVTLTAFTSENSIVNGNVKKTTELLSVLIESAATVEVEDLDVPENSGKNLPQLLAEAFVNNDPNVVVSTTSHCKKAHNSREIGVFRQKCTFSIHSKEDDFESTIIILFNTSRLVIQDSKTKISDVRVQRAG